MAPVFCTVLSPKITDFSCILQELKLKHFRSTAAKEMLHFVQLKTTIHNIYQMITHTRRISVDTEDTFKQLEMVNNAKILLAILNEPVQLICFFFTLRYTNLGTLKFIKVITQQSVIKCSMQAEVSQLLC